MTIIEKLDKLVEARNLVDSVLVDKGNAEGLNISFLPYGWYDDKKVMLLCEKEDLEKIAAIIGKEVRYEEVRYEEPQHDDDDEEEEDNEFGVRVYVVYKGVKFYTYSKYKRSRI